MHCAPAGARAGKGMMPSYAIKSKKLGLDPDMHIHTHIYTYNTYACIHTYIHTHIHTHIHTYMSGKGMMPSYAIKSKKLGLDPDEIEAVATYVLEQVYI